MAGRALLTGAAGFIGSTLGETLIRNGWEVVGVDSFLDNYDSSLKERNLRSLVSEKRFRFVRGDLNRIDLAPLLDGVDTVFHQAAQPGVRASWGAEFDRYVESNILATQKLLEQCREREIDRFVFASSSSVYGETSELPLKEGTPKRPYSPYGVTKLAAENLGHLYRKNHGVPFVALRYFTVFGPRQRPDMAFYRIMDAAFHDREMTLFGTGEQTRDFTYVEDIVRANLAAAEADTTESVFNIGGGARISLGDVIRMAEEITGRKVPLRRTAWEKGDVRDTWADCSSAKRELGYRPGVSFREGLERMVAWFREAAESGV